MIVCTWKFLLQHGHLVSAEIQDAWKTTTALRENVEISFTLESIFDLLVFIGWPIEIPRLLIMEVHEHISQWLIVILWVHGLIQIEFCFCFYFCCMRQPGFRLFAKPGNACSCSGIRKTEPVFSGRVQVFGEGHWHEADPKTENIARNTRWVCSNPRSR